MEKIILKSKITGFMAGKKLQEEYRMAMKQRGGKWVLFPEQSFNGKFNEYSSLPAWNLSSLLQGRAKHELYIDAEQRWSIKGVDSAIREAVRYI